MLHPLFINVVPKMIFFTCGHVFSRIFTSVTVHPVAVFSILDHFLRRNVAEDRVIGTLLGSRIDGVIHVKNAFAVLHKESEDQVAVDLEYHRTMLDLQTKANPNETIVGW